MSFGQIGGNVGKQLDPYPQKLRERAHELYYEQRNHMSDVLTIIQEEYPMYAARLNRDRLHSVARQYRLRLGLPAKTKVNAKKRQLKKKRLIKQKMLARAQAPSSPGVVAVKPPSPAPYATYMLSLSNPSGTSLLVEIPAGKVNEVIQTLLAL